MATIRVRDWTKERIEEVREAESHSSHDSVIKSLLKDRELARFAGVESAPGGAADEPATIGPPGEGAVDGLTVLAELEQADNGVLFLWCPGCGNEVAHLTVENPVSITVFEVECQRCLTHLDQHALVAIELSYPLEERLVEETLLDDLQACVVDYWDRVLASVRDAGPGAVASTDGDVDPERLAWQLDGYASEFNWDWPTDVPVVGLSTGRTYRDERTGEHLVVESVVDENRSGPDAYQVLRHPPGGDPAEAETEELDAETVTDLVVGRALTLVEDDGE